MNYRSEIDGLRAVAVMPVIFYHADLRLFSGGFVGVDVFFVISGFLITTIILAEIEQGRFSLVTFYERRARRILPALFLVMVVSLPFAWMLLFPQDFKDFSQSLISTSLFSSNIQFWRESDYFNPDAGLKPLLHTWSLGVEEQYYLLFPLFLMLMWRLGKRWVAGSFLVLVCTSLALAQWGVYNKPDATFYLLPTRIWELGIGAIIAFYFLHRKAEALTITPFRVVDEGLAIMGLAMIVFSVLAFDKYTPFPGAYALLPTIGAGLVIVFSSPQTIAGRLLSTKLFVGVGLISYSAYLWHLPLIVFARHAMVDPATLISVILPLASLLFAYLSWRFVEKPFRQRGRISRKTIFSFAAIGSLVFIIVGFIGYLSDGLPSREVRPDLGIRNYQPNNRILQHTSWTILRNLAGNKKYGVEDNQYDLENWYDEADPRGRLLLVGNSHSKDLFNVLTHSKSANKRFQSARYGTQIKDIGQRFFGSVNYRLADIIIFVSRYKDIDIERYDDVVSQVIADGKKVVLVRSAFEFSMYNSKRYNLADKLIQQNNADEENLGQEFPAIVNHQHYLEYVRRKPKSRLLKSELEILKSDQKLKQLADRFDSIVILDRMNYVCDRSAEQCYAINDKLEKYFYDYGHHTLEGARFFAQRIDKVGWLDDL